MAQEPNDRVTIREYLLGQLPDSQLQDFERRLVSEDTAFEELLVGEDDLIDAYLKGELDAEQKDRFESIFIATSERQNKLRFGRAFMNYVSLQTANRSTAHVERPTPTWWRQLFAPPARIVAYALLIVGVAVASWLAFFRQSDVDKGLIALNDAYRQQRPVEARISQLDYAPFSVMRGAEPERVDSLARDRAERILLDAVHNKPGAESYHALGKLYLAKKDFDRAIAQFEEGLKAEPNNAQTYADLGAALLEKGKLELERGKSDRASSEAGKGLEDLGRSLENLSKALELNPNLLEALFNRALCFQYMMLPHQAEEAWRQYLQKDSGSQWAAEAQQSLNLLEQQKAKAAESEERLQWDFLSAFDKRDDEQAWAALSRSRRRTGDRVVEGLLDSYINLRVNGRLNDAQETLQRIVYAGNVELKKSGDRYTFDIARLYGSATSEQVNSLSAARNQMKVANAAFNKGEFEKAIDLYTAARKSFARLGNIPESVFAENWIGYSLLRIPKPEESVRIFESASRELELRNYKSLLVVSLNALGDAQLSLNEFSKTLEYVGRGLLVSEQIQDYSSTIRCLAQRVTINLTLNDYKKSLESLTRALDLAGTIPPEPKVTWPLYHDGALTFHFLGLPASAVAFEQEALRLADLSGVPLLRSRSWERLGIIYSQQKNFGKAIESGENALAEARNISGELSQKNVSARSMLILGQLHREAGNFKKSIEYFDQSLTLYQQLNFPAYSYQAHKGKLLALIALNDDGTASNELNTVITLFEDQRKNIIEESNRDRFFDAGQDTYDLAIDFASSKRKDDQQAFEYAEASRARSLFEMMNTGARLIEDHNGLEIRLRADTVPLALSEIQRQMPEKAQLLEYAVLDNKVLMWVVTRSFIKSAQTNTSASDLDQTIRTYVQFLEHGSSGNNEAMLLDAKRLHTILISPIEGFLDKNLQLCIVADKSLNYLPFAALISQSSGRYLVEDYELEQAPSATIFIRCSEVAKDRKDVSNERLLSVGNPQFNRSEFPSLNDLPSAAREAKEIASFYRSATSYIGEDASSEHVTRALHTADVVHLAMHAVADERSPLYSQLLLSHVGTAKTSDEANGVLRASEIYRLKFPNTRLVVLSACQTGIENAYRGEGAIGLARPFIAAGVPLVVASLWSIESEATADLMISFHKHRKQDNLSTVAALRRAQLEFLHNRQPGSPSNNGWAAFVAIGGYAGF